MKVILGFAVVALLGSLGIVLFEPAPDPVPVEDPRFATPSYNRAETDWNDYIWPTDASDAKTSSFCEFRKTHFHAGIDISTNMKRGYNTLASRAGWLHSIEFEPGGYGWFLVLRHYDGYYTCYAHLDGFPEQIERAYIEKLEEMKKSVGYAEWSQDEVKVRKGDIVAFTGATGAGPPHLHFEIRDRNFNPVNPELAPHIRVQDSRPPEFQQVAFVPLDPFSTVNGRNEVEVISARKMSDTLYQLRGSPVLRGRIGVQVRAIDGAEGFKDMETPYRLLTTLNGKKHFLAVFDKIQDDHGWYIRIDRNNDFMLRRKGEFRKLYKEPGNTLDVYLPNSPWAGILNTDVSRQGINAYTVQAGDPSGNTSLLQCTYSMIPEVDLKLSAVSTDAVALSTGPGSAPCVVEITGYGSTKSTLWKHRIVPGSAPLKWKLPSPSEVYSVRALDSAGHELQQLFCSRRIEPGGRLSGSYRVAGGGLRVTIQSATPFNLPPIVTLHGGSGSTNMRIEAVTPTEYTALVAIPDDVRPPFRVEAQALVSGELLSWNQPVREVFISPEYGGTLFSHSSSCRVEFGPADVLLPGFYSLSETTTPEGTIYAVHPSDIPLTGQIQVSIRPPYRHDGKNFIQARCPSVYMRYGTETFNRASEWVTGHFGRYPAEYMLRRDTTAPMISVQTLRHRLPLIRIADDGSGVNRESILVRSGKDIVPLVYNERTSGYEIPAEYLHKHKVKDIVVTVSDRVGNFSMKNARL